MASQVCHLHGKKGHLCLPVPPAWKEGTSMSTSVSGFYNNGLLLSSTVTGRVKGLICPSMLSVMVK